MDAFLDDSPRAILNRLASESSARQRRALEKALYKDALSHLAQPRWDARTVTLTFYKKNILYGYELFYEKNSYFNLW